MNGETAPRADVPDPVAALVRDHDPDRWAASLFWPTAVRSDALALLAFDAELTHIADVVSEPMVGEIRMQWWQEAIAARSAGGHPVATALIDVIDRYNLDRAAFADLIAAHQTALYDDPYDDSAALMARIDATDGTMFAALARVLAPGRLPPPGLDAAARAYGLTRRLRHLPADLARGRHPLPRDVLDRFGVPPSHLDDRRMSPALRLVLGALIASARENHARLCEHWRQPEAGLAAALPAHLCPAYLALIAAPRTDIFKDPLRLAPWRRLWILWRAARRLP